MIARPNKLLVLSAFLATIFFVAKDEATSATGQFDQFAAIAYAPISGDVATNRQRLAQLIAQAAERGAKYVVLPELSLTGPIPKDPQKIKDLALEETIPGPSTLYFAECAKKCEVWLAVSIVEKAPNPQGHYISTVLFDETGAIAQVYRKVIPRTNGEDGAGIIRGSPRAVLESFDHKERRIGILSGDDIQIGVPRLSNRGAETILIAANWTAQDPIDWKETCQQLSHQYQVNLVVANRQAAAAKQSASLLPSAIFFADGTTARYSNPANANEQLLIAPLPTRSVSINARAPLGLPSIPFPTDYPVNERVVELGRALFFDKNLSSSGKVSCASCHQPTKAFADGLAQGVGVYGRKTERNVPSLLNVAYRGLLFWDGFAATLENQVKYPMSHASEMNLHYLEATDYIRNRPEYADMFRAAFNAEDVKFEHIARALSSYQRTLISGDTPFDKYYYGKDEQALSASAKRGLKLFLGKANCAACHTINNKNALFMDQQFHNTGVAYNRATRAFADAGFGEIGYEGQYGLFLTPSLRNIALTAPYMHNGSIATLKGVVEYYNNGGNKNPYLDHLIKPLRLTGQESDDLVNFLYSLNGNAQYSADGRKIDGDAKYAEQATTFAAIEFAPALGRYDLNSKSLKNQIERAARDNARFVAVPEHALTGSLSRLNLSSERMNQLAKRVGKQAIEEFGRLAKELKIWIALPTLEYDEAQDGYFITTFLLDDSGRLAAQQRKLAPKQEWGDGSALKGDFRSLQSIETSVGRIGILSGDDILTGIPRLANRGAATILISASWNRSDFVKWMDASIDLAKQHKVNLVISNLKEPDAELDRAIVLNDGTVIKNTSSSDGEALIAKISRRKDPLEIEPSLGLPSIPQPTYAPLTSQSVELGRKLFFDANLSRDKKVSCATCHDPKLAFADHKTIAEGVFGRLGKKNVPTLLNSAYRTFQSWEGHVDSPESQVGHALHGYGEMDMTVGEVLAYLERSAEYRDAFRALTGKDVITFDEVSRSIANYQRTLVAGNSPFDRYYFGGDAKAISEKAKRGFDLFSNKANCAACHHLTKNYALFTDNDFHNTGVGYHKRFDYLGYSGNGIEGNQATKNRFRGEYLTPSLRNLTLTKPYMHDGSLPTLRDVVRFYERGGIKNPFIDRRIKPFKLTEEERESLIEFLTALTSDRRSMPNGLTTASSLSRKD